MFYRKIEKNLRLYRQIFLRRIFLTRPGLTVPQISSVVPCATAQSHVPGSATLTGELESRCCVVGKVVRWCAKGETSVREGLVRENGMMIGGTGLPLHAWRTVVIVIGELRTKSISSDNAL